MARRASGRRVLHKLDARSVATAVPGRYGDGGGLYLVVRKNGSKFWLFRFMRHRQPEEMHLGSFDHVTPEEARDQAAASRKLVREGRDPRIVRAEQRGRVLDVITFRQDASEYIEAKKSGWSVGYLKNCLLKLDKHIYDIRLSNGKTMGDLPVNNITMEDVLQVLKPIWAEKNPTAVMVRMLIEEILDYSKAHKHRDGENPARWRGNLKAVLPQPSKVHKKKHLAAIHYSRAPALVADLHRHECISAFALEFDIICPIRIGVATSAEWREFNPVETPAGVTFPHQKWLVPQEKMKDYKVIDYPDGVYPVPLIQRMESILQSMWKIRDNEFVFPGRKRGTHIGSPAVLALLRSVTADPSTTHGFRSTLMDWLDELVFVEDWVKEMCLGHSVGTDTQRAYRRSDLFEKRRLVHEAWAEYLLTGNAVVVDIKEKFKERFKGKPIFALALAVG